MNQRSHLPCAFVRTDNDGAVVEYAAVAALLCLVSIGAVTDTVVAPDDVSRLIAGVAGCASPTLSTGAAFALGLFSIVLDTILRLIAAAIEYAIPALSTATALVLCWFGTVFDYVLEYGSRVLSTATAFVGPLFSLAR